jgi:hypothetical protein
VQLLLLRAAAANIIATNSDSVNPLKVSFMITDSEGGLEFGDNAVMVEGFSAAPMMTNQQALSFGTDGVLNYDALNFELPNLNQGALTETAASLTRLSPTAACSMTCVPHLTLTRLMNDWASFETDTATVATDWVVTLARSVHNDEPIC